MSAADSLAVTVLVCSRDRPTFLRDAIQSVLAGACVPVELLAVDQSNSFNAAVDRIGTVRGCTVRYLHSTTRGLSRARNIGLQFASHEIVVMIDDDMLVDSSWLELLVQAAVAAGSRGVATGRVMAGPPGAGSGRVPAAGLVTLSEPATFRGRQARDVMPGANVAVRRGVVLALGGYDERLGAGTRFGGADDNDMGFRLLEAGCEIRHVPDAVAFHRPWRSRGGRLHLRWRYARGKGAFYAKHVRLSDSFMWRRLTSELRSRTVRSIAAVPQSPTVALGEVVSFWGIVSGAVSWTARELVIVRCSRKPRDRVAR